MSVPASRPRERAAYSSFFFWLGIAYLLLTLLGFLKSFYLRPFFDNRDITPDVYVHGAVLSTWFALFAVQVSLIAARRPDWHRILGRIGVVVAALVVTVSLPVAWLRPSRVVANPPPGYDLAADIPHLGMVVIGNTGFLALFAIFVGLAVAWRHRPASHKRLMALASYAILGPAIGRIDTLWGEAGVTNQSLAAGIIGLAIPAAIIWNDLRTRRRLHRVTAIGLALIFGWLILTFLLSATIGEPLIRALAAWR